jgi:hypothetical protein
MTNGQTQAIKEIQAEVTRAKRLHPGEFHNAHEGYAVLLEEVRELEREVFFGKKIAKAEYDNDLNPEYIEKMATLDHRARMREEAIQIGAMAVRFAAELTDPNVTDRT